MGCGALSHMVHIFPDALSFYELKEGRVHAIVRLVSGKLYSKPHKLILKSNSRNTNWIVDPFMQVK